MCALLFFLFLFLFETIQSRRSLIFPFLHRISDRKRMTWLNEWFIRHIPSYKRALKQADPRTENWFLLWNDPIPTLTLTGLYFALVYFGPRLMHAHRPIQIPTVILFTYNILLAILSVYIVVEVGHPGCFSTPPPLPGSNFSRLSFSFFLVPI